MGAVQDQVVLDYEAWLDRWTSESRRTANGGNGVSRKGKGREDEVWDAGVFAEWAVGVFRVGKGLDAGGGDEDGDSREVSLGSSSGDDDDGNE